MPAITLMKHGARKNISPSNFCWRGDTKGGQRKGHRTIKSNWKEQRWVRSNIRETRTLLEAPWCLRLAVQTEKADENTNSRRSKISAKEPPLPPRLLQCLPGNEALLFCTDSFVTLNLSEEARGSFIANRSTGIGGCARHLGSVFWSV